MWIRRSEMGELRSELEEVTAERDALLRSLSVPLADYDAIEQGIARVHDLREVEKAMSRYAEVLGAGECPATEWAEAHRSSTNLVDGEHVADRVEMGN